MDTSSNAGALIRMGAVFTVALLASGQLFAQQEPAPLTIIDRAAESALAFAAALQRTQVIAVASGAVTFAITAFFVAALSRTWWVSTPLLQWVLLLLAPTLAAGAGGGALMLSLRDMLDKMPDQSLHRVLSDPSYYDHADVDRAVHDILQFKRIAEQGPYFFWWAVSCSPVLIAATLGFAGCLVLWFTTNRQVIEGRATSPSVH